MNSPVLKLEQVVLDYPKKESIVNFLKRKLGFILAFGSSIGAWWSSRWSVERGEGVIKQILVIAVSVMAVKLWFF